MILPATDMTQDFLMDFCEACKKEGWSFVVIVAPPGTNSALVKVDLDNWEPHPKTTKSQDILDILKTCEVIE